MWHVDTFVNILLQTYSMICRTDKIDFENNKQKLCLTKFLNPLFWDLFLCSLNTECNAAPRTVDNLIKAQCPRAVSGHTNVEGCEPWSIGTPFGASVALNPAHKIFMYWYIQSEVTEMYLGEILFLTLLHFEELLQAGSCTYCELHFVPQYPWWGGEGFKKVHPKLRKHREGPY